MENFIPDDQFVPDEQIVPTTTLPEPTKQVQSNDFIPDEQFVSDEDKYGTLEQTSKAVLESLGRGAAGPLFTGAEIALGVKPEAIAGRKETLGTPADIGLQAAGFVLPGMLTGGISSLAKAGYLPEAVSSVLKAAEWGTTAKQLGTIGNLATRGIEGNVARVAAKYGLEGGLLSLSDDISNKLISIEHEDAKEVAGSFISHALASSVFGAVLGAGVGKLSPLWTAKEGATTGEAIEKLMTDASPDLAQPQAVTVRPKPTSLDEIAARVKEAKLPITPVELPAKQALLDADKRLLEKNQFPVLPLQSDALDNPVINDKFRIFKESGTKEAKDYLNYEALQKRQSIEGMKNVIGQLSENPIDDAAKGGRKAVEIARKKYISTKKGFEDFFTQFDEIGTNPVKYAGEITGLLEDAIPGLGEHLQFDGINGKVALDKWRPTMPFTEETYKAAKVILDAVNEENLTLGKIRNARNNLDPYINYITGDARTNAQVGRLQSSLMSFIEKEAQKAVPDLPVRENFRAYAQNERNRETLEKMLRGKLFGVGPLERQIVTEDVLKNLFADSNTVEALRNIVGEENFKSILADYLSQAMKSVTDIERGGFSSNKFSTFLKNKTPELETAFVKNPQMLQEIRDWNTIMKILPDAPSVNPSGTAKTVMEMMKGVLNVKNYTPTALLGNIAEKVSERREEKAAIKFLNDVLAGKVGEAKPGAAAITKVLESKIPTNAGAFRALLDYYTNASKGALLINKAIHGIFDADKMPNIKDVDPAKLDKLDKQAQMFLQDPTHIMNVGGHVAHYAPEQAVALTSQAVNIANYLNAKRPQPKIIGPLDRPIPISAAQKNSYYRTLQIAENPLTVLKKIHNGTLHSSDVVDFKNMYPDLYNLLAKKAYNQMNEHIAKDKPVPFKIRKTLSIFAGEPLDSTMRPQSILTAQSVFQPQQQPQAQLPQMAKKSSKVSKLPSLTETDQQRRMLKQ